MIAGDTWDCVVVGAGPAGAVTALLLARAGRRVAIVDAARFPRQKVCGEYLSSAAWQLLDELGLGNLRGQAVELSGMRLDVAGGRRATLDFPAPSPAPASLSRYSFDAALVAAARAAGVDVFEGYRVKQVLAADGRITGLAAIDADHPRASETFRAPLIVAADGRRSLVVRDTGRVARGRSGLVGFKAHTDGPMPAGSETTLVMHSLPDGYIGVCPVEGGRINVCGVMPRQRLRSSRGNLAQALRLWIAESGPSQSYLDIDREPEGWLTMPEVTIQRSYARTPGVLYVGDAMGTIEPLTGQGMTMALASARLAARHLLACEAASIDRAGQMAYEQAWHAQFATTIRASRWMGWLLRHPRLLSAMIATGEQVPGLLPGLLGAAHRRSLAVAAPR
ncbi:MAG TPA: FAD-dependent monooxygenase [Pirellulales bacterium]|jgi:flavin-dependent dehydrogenase|nr:FAD-dependent monooxygenase [Pirellulales bacterium]